MSAENVARRVTVVELLEARFPDRVAVMVGRGALGMAAVLATWQRDRGRSLVALPAAICHEVLLAVLAAGCEPFFCDVDPATGLVPAQEWVRARAAGASVAIVVHLYGNPADTRAVREIFASPACLVIDDAAQALGAITPSGAAGAIGDVGVLSFGHTKQIDVGNGALLFADRAFAEQVRTWISGIEPVDAARRGSLANQFRARLDSAREGLRRDEEGGAKAFAGLLEGLAPVLSVAVDPSLNPRIENALVHYAARIESRRKKAQVWRHLLAGSALIAVGMSTDGVPWRYVCRFPGATWAKQASLADRLRHAGLDVSTWYLPAHWYLGAAPGTLPGAERLAREVFQFWLDDATTESSIIEFASIIRRELGA